MTISLAAEPIFHIGSFPVTNTLLVSYLIIIVLTLGVFVLKLGLKTVPARAQGMAELVIENILKLIEGVTQDKKIARKFFPLIATFFIFIILSNWVEVVPGLGTIGIWEEHGGEKILVPFIRSTSADLNFTLALAIVSVFCVQIFGILAIGFYKYAGKFINFKNPIYFFIGILELLAELSRIISYSFRLFGNIFAGEVLLTVMLFLIPYIVPLPFLLMELFVGFIQALIFSMLTLVFLKIAMTSH